MAAAGASLCNLLFEQPERVLRQHATEIEIDELGLVAADERRPEEAGKIGTGAAVDLRGRPRRGGSRLASASASCAAAKSAAAVSLQ